MNMPQGRLFCLSVNDPVKAIPRLERGRPRFYGNLEEDGRTA
jgi:hypothetical protein